VDNLYWLEQIKSSDRTAVGDKAWQLGKVLQLGYPAVPGFVIGAQVWQQFLENLPGTEPLVADLPHSSLHLDVDNPQELQRVAQRLRQEITAAPLPAEWLEKLFQAVKVWQTATLIFRPSLTLNNHSTKKAGELLEAQVCSCDQEAIALTLKQTWSQLFRARSLLYWQRAGIKLQQINLAVLVQPLTDALAAGSLSYGWEEMEIKASWGLGMAIAKGEVIPDSYRVQSQTGMVLSQQLGSKAIAYGLTTASAPAGFKHWLPQTASSCLQVYLPDESQQQYALPDEHLQQLIQLATRLAHDLGAAFSLEWMLSQLPSSAQIQITQVTASENSSRPKEYFIKGLAAAAGKVVAPTYVVADFSQKPATLPAGVILVAPAIAPDWLPLLQQVVGVVTEQGGLTSHSAILARELGIPAIVSAAKATALLQTGEVVLLDGDQGEICRVQESQAEKLRQIPSPHLSVYHQPLSTGLMVNLSQPNLLTPVKALPVDGIGLLRSELMVLNLLEGQHPNRWLAQGREHELLNLWQEQITLFARALAPKPVFYRSLDWRAHEFPSLVDESLALAEPSSPPQNSMLGLRGTFSYLQNPRLFDLELTALAAVQRAHRNLHLILPFVRTVEEFVFCRRRVEQAGLTAFSQFQLWIMAEVPSVLFLLPDYVKAGVQGISIGTNDLTQLLLGVDRDQGQLAAAFDERHPAVMQALAQLIRAAREANIPCSLCGQAPVLYPELLDSLVRWGITSISVEPEAVDSTYAGIARAEQRLIVEAARSQLTK